MDYVTETVNIRPVSIQAILFRNPFLNGKVATTPDEFKGVKVRIPENPSIEACFSAVGATPVAIPSGEAYTSVQTGVVDGLEGNVEYVSQMKFYEVADTCSLTEHVMTFTTMCISNEVYESFRPELKKAFDEAVTEAMDYFYPMYEEIEVTSMEILKEENVSFHEVDKEALMATCAPRLESFVNENGLQDVYAAIKALV